MFFYCTARKPRKNAGPRAVLQRPLGGPFWGASGVLWGPLGPFWAPKRYPKDPKMTPNNVSKQQKTNQKEPKATKSNILGAQGVRKAIFGAKKRSQGVISGTFGKEKIISGGLFGSLGILRGPFGTQNEPLEGPEGSKMIILDQKCARRGPKSVFWDPHLFKKGFSEGSGLSKCEFWV